MSMDLSTSYLGLSLKNPIVPSASPLSHSLDGMKRLEDNGAAAIVMYSLFEEQIEHESAELEHYLSYGTQSFAEALTYFPETTQYNLGPDEYVDLIVPRGSKDFVAHIKEKSRIPVMGHSDGVCHVYLHEDADPAMAAALAVDSKAQVIVAADVTQQTNDKRQTVPMLLKVQENLGCLPEKVTADSGYFSEANVTDPRLAGVEMLVPPEKHVTKMLVAKQMRERLETDAGRATYKMRKAIVEPVFGQIKQARGFRAFSFRGLERVSAEWALICLTHNLLKLFQAGACSVPA